MIERGILVVAVAERALAALVAASAALGCAWAAASGRDWVIVATVGSVGVWSLYLFRRGFEIKAGGGAS